MDIVIEQVVHAAPAEVARIMFDPQVEDRWTESKDKAEVLTPGPLGIGSRVRHAAKLLGLKSASFVTEVVELEPERKLAMEIVEGPERGLVTYQVSPTAGGSIAAIHVRSHPKLPIPLVPWARKQQIQENLHRLSNLVAHNH